MEYKTEIVRKTTFSTLSTNLIGPPLRLGGVVQPRIDKVRVRRELFEQSQKKVPRPDRLNFSMLQLLWESDAGRITALIRHSILLGHHLGA